MKTDGILILQWIVNTHTSIYPKDYPTNVTIKQDGGQLYLAPTTPSDNATVCGIDTPYYWSLWERNKYSVGSEKSYNTDPYRAGTDISPKSGYQ